MKKIPTQKINIFLKCLSNTFIIWSYVWLQEKSINTEKYRTLQIFSHYNAVKSEINNKKEYNSPVHGDIKVPSTPYMKNYSNTNKMNTTYGRLRDMIKVVFRENFVLK